MKALFHLSHKQFYLSFNQNKYLLHTTQYSRGNKCNPTTSFFLNKHSNLIIT
jgi:hypothetical protein